MADQQAPQQPNEPDKQSWLRRQWANLRAGRWRDVIIANVDEGAENVAVGKNIFQINVGGHNITPYVATIMLAVLLVVGYFFYPYVEPIWNPYQMRGDTNIAVADFGVFNPNGKIELSDFGSILSESVFEQLNDEYTAIEAANAFDGNVDIWHDALPREVKNVRFGVIQGATREERGATAARLAERVGADMVIYGYLTDQESPEGLVLEFYFASPAIADEPDAVVGHHALGRAIPAALDLFNIDPTTAKAQARQPLADRTSAVFFLTLGLTYGLANEHEEALATFQRAEQELSGWKDADGKAVLYFFMGRSAFLSRRHDVAISALEEALRINPDYINAQITLGQVYIDRAQLFFVRDRELPPEIAACLPDVGFENASSELADAIADIEIGLSYLDEAVSKAPDDMTPPLKEVGMLSRAMGRNLRGQAALFDGDPGAADEAAAAAQAEFDAIVQPFTDADQPRFVAWTHFGNGLAHQLQGHLRIVDAVNAKNDGDDELGALRRSEGIALFEQARDLFEDCIDEAESDDLIADLLVQKFILACGCRPYRDLAAQTVQEQMEAQK